ncbi:N-acetylglucosamine-6-phosphate deacetylase [Salinibacterium sp. G-O1]|uniref:N-acetylglucosamine-6-phosphate deacetylase n=1 Tax=Salinibacterium sp. G-O1 TaxID=3046208 RepID=UPI0024B926B9|nr:N-acetylglucosamine-6-phosphate deacetylase [Salinibacterium sp. G-O1]MDJ0335991.1 N-acetylglucosamine-6-phosphate deacetylase [Salinibacterium sp. G-O1]
MATLFHSARKLDAHGQVDDFWMLVDCDTITSTGSGHAHPAATEKVDVAGRWLVPGFIDLHGHGGGGHAYDDGPGALTAALATHRQHGTTRSVISLVANPINDLLATLDTIAEFAARDPLVLGAHLEGPFLAPENRGAPSPEYLLEPSPATVDLLLNAARGTLRQITIAPELPNALEAMDILVEAGVAVAIGHTMADEVLARRAFDAGARILTHAFNAMPGIHHRAPGPIVAAFNDDRVTLELILDGMHVHPSVARLAFGAAPGRIALVTDAMAAAGSDDGEYTLGSRDVTVRDGLATLSGTTTIAGSTLTQDAALRLAVTDARVPPLDAVTALTLTPARALGLEHRHGLLSPGFAADAVLLDDDWQVTDVWAAGGRIRG